MVASVICQRILVIEDHQYVLENLAQHLQQHYPNAQIVTANTVEHAMEKLAEWQPELLISDLAIPVQEGAEDKFENGIQLLRDVLKQYPNLNIAVLSSRVKALIRIKPLINEHKGGFAIIPKTLQMSNILSRVDWATQGEFFVNRELQTGVEIQPEWLTLLQLAFDEGLQDKEISKRMNISERTTRRYWDRIQDVLNIHPEAGSNKRTLTGKRAREEGLID